MNNMIAKKGLTTEQLTIVGRCDMRNEHDEQVNNRSKLKETRRELVELKHELGKAELKLSRIKNRSIELEDLLGDSVLRIKAHEITGIVLNEMYELPKHYEDQIKKLGS